MKKIIAFLGNLKNLIIVIICCLYTAMIFPQVIPFYNWIFHFIIAIIYSIFAIFTNINIIVLNTICFGIGFTINARKLMNATFILKFASFISAFPFIWHILLLIEHAFQPNSLDKLPKFLLAGSFRILTVFVVAYITLFLVNRVCLFVINTVKFLHARDYKTYSLRAVASLIIIISFVQIYSPFLSLINSIDKTVTYNIFSGLVHGCVDKTGKTIIEPKYLANLHFINGVSFMMIGEKWGAIDKTGELVIKPQFDEINFNYHESTIRDLFLVKVGNKWGYIDKTGKIVIPPQFKKADYFHENLARVSLDGRMWGYIDKKGRMVIEPQFYSAYNFSKGFAVIELEDNNYPNNKYGLIDKTGKLIVNPEYIAIDYSRDIFCPQNSDIFTDGLLRVKRDNKWGLINRTGKFVVNLKFDDIGYLPLDGLIAVKVGNKWGYINKTGRMVIKPQFDEAGIFIEGFSYISINNKWNYIDKTGKIIVNPKFKNKINFLLKENRPVIDKQGKLVEPANNRYLFSKNLYITKKNGKKGIVDNNGKVVVKHEFDDISSSIMKKTYSKEFIACNNRGTCNTREIYSFSCISKGGKFGLIDEKGNFIIQPQFDRIYVLNSEMITVVKDEKWGLVDKTGKVIIEPKYDLIYDAGEDMIGIAIKKISWVF